MSRLKQEPPEPQERAVIFGCSPEPLAMTWLVLLTTRSSVSALHSGHFISTFSSDFRRIFSQTFPHFVQRNSKIGISCSLDSGLFAKTIATGADEVKPRVHDLCENRPIQSTVSRVFAAA